MKLTEDFVEQVALADTSAGRKYADGHGFYLHVSRTGKYWRMAYRLGGKPKLLALGVYPEVSLQHARNEANAARKSLAAGVDPALRKKEMTSIVNAENQGRRPQHPGAVLREKVLPGLAITTGAFAKALALPLATAERLLKESMPVTCRVALKLEHLLSIKAEEWMGMQQAVDLWDARSEHRRIQEYGRALTLKALTSGQVASSSAHAKVSAELLNTIAKMGKEATGEGA